MFCFVLPPGGVGYFGPCPGTQHTYRFTVYAIDVATLPGIDTASSGDAVQAAILLNDLASATLTGTYAP